MDLETLQNAKVQKLISLQIYTKHWKYIDSGPKTGNLYKETGDPPRPRSSLTQCRYVRLQRTNLRVKKAKSLRDRSKATGTIPGLKAWSADIFGRDTGHRESSGPCVVVSLVTCVLCVPRHVSSD